MDTKLLLYQTCVLQILLYGADTWTLLANDIRRLQSFHMGCQRQILGVRWQDYVKNVDIADTTGLPNTTDIVDKKRHALFGHVVRLDTSVPAHQALKQVIAMKAGRCSGMNWRRLPVLVVLERHGYSRLATEQQPAGNRCGRVQRSVDIAESRRNRPQLSTRHDDDDDVILNTGILEKCAQLCIVRQKDTFKQIHVSLFSVPFSCPLHSQCCNRRCFSLPSTQDLAKTDYRRH